MAGASVVLLLLLSLASRIGGHHPTYDAAGWGPTGVEEGVDASEDIHERGPWSFLSLEVID